jgi:hypothetical protein
MARKRTRKSKKARVGLLYRASAMATVAVLCMSADGAFAAPRKLVHNGVNQLAGNEIIKSHGMSQLFNLFAYVGGVALVAFGIIKLKQHVDHPGDVPMRQGMMRLLAAGMLLSLPFMTKIMQGSVAEKTPTAAPVISHVTYFGTAGGAYMAS